MLDLRQILQKYNPDNPFHLWWGYNNNRVLRQFTKGFTIKRIISAEFVDHYDCPREDAVWTMIEYLYPHGSGTGFEEDHDAMMTFGVLVDTIIEETFHYIQKRLPRHQLETVPEDLLFEEWISQTAAVFVHKDFHVEYDLLGDPIRKF